MQTGIGTAWLGPGRGLKLEKRVRSGVGSGVHEGAVGSTAQQLRLRDTMLADLRSQNKALAGAAQEPYLTLDPRRINTTRASCSVLSLQLTKTQRVAVNLQYNGIVWQKSSQEWPISTFALYCQDLYLCTLSVCATCKEGPLAAEMLSLQLCLHASVVSATVVSASRASVLWLCRSAGPIHSGAAPAARAAGQVQRPQGP